MPTINFSLRDLQKLVGRKIDAKQLSELMLYAKGETNVNGDEVNVDFGDTNLPYLWSVEGVARFLKGVLGIERGIPKLNVKKSNYKIIVDKSVIGVRPCLAAFVAKGWKVNDYLIKQMVQLQEKLCEGYGRRRQKISIGIYRHKNIKFPVYYKATDPESVKFVPLEFKRAMTQKEILEELPKGKEYAWILSGVKKYPLLVDSADEVLSFPPIINSNTTGKIEIGDEDLLIEVTGTDMDSVNLSAMIFARAFGDRGFDIYEVEISYPNKKINSPYPFNQSVKISKEQIKNILGIELKDSEVKRLLEMARYNFNNYNVKIPDYRNDILHPVDIIEDIAIMRGYDNVEELPLKTQTVGKTFKINEFVDKVRELAVGLGYQEVTSPILSNKELMYKRMNINDFGTVEIENPMSASYACVRSWLMPILMDVLSKNKHVEYPQKIFEEGIVVSQRGGVKEDERVACVSAHNGANFTEIKQVLDALLSGFGADYKIVPAVHNSFVPGRCARVVVKDKEIAFIGEIHPQVLENFGTLVPVAGFELNLTELFGLIS